MFCCNACKNGGAPLKFASDHIVWRCTETTDPSMPLPLDASQPGTFYQRAPGKAPPVARDPGCGQRAVYWLLAREEQKNYFMHGNNMTSPEDLNEHLRPFGLTVAPDGGGPIRGAKLDHGFGSIVETTHCWLIQILFLADSVRHWMAFDGRARVLFVGLAAGNGPKKNLFYQPDNVSRAKINRFISSVLGARISSAYVIRHL
jgi:hypothetical protein